MPLVKSWTLRKAKKGKPEVWVEPVVDFSSKTISYKVNYEGGGVLVLVLVYEPLR